MTEAKPNETIEKNAPFLKLTTADVTVCDLTDQPEEKVMTQKEIEEIAFITKSLESAKKKKEILKGKVILITPYILDDELTACAVIDMGDDRVKAIIPYIKLFTDPPIKKFSTDTEAGKESYFKRQRQCLNRFLNSEVEYMIEKVTSYGDHIVVHASRVAACEKLIQACYEGDNPQIKEGHVYKGRILYCKDTTAVVTLGGVDRAINKDSMTNRYLPDLRAYYKAGMPVSIKIENLHYDENGKYEHVNFDMYGGELKDAEENIKKLQPGSTVIVTLSRVQDFDRDKKKGKLSEQEITEGEASKVKKGKVYYILYGWIESLNIPVKVDDIVENRFGVPLKVGDQLICSVREDSRDRFLHCSPIAVYGASGI